jgi:hypothetical protein
VATVVEGPDPLAGVSTGAGIGPFPEQGVNNEAFTLALSLGAVRLGKALADPAFQSGAGTRSRVIGTAFVGQDPLQDDATRRVPGTVWRRKAAEVGPVFRQSEPRRTRAGSDRRLPLGRVPSRCRVAWEAASDEGLALWALLRRQG